jgi:hypothetical protein
MKVLDERGRIAGLINVFDLVILLAAAFLAFYYWVEVPRLLNPPARGLAALPARSDDEQLGVLLRKQPGILEDVVFLFKDVDPEVAPLIQSGDRDTAHPQTQVEIMEILGIQPMRVAINLGKRQTLASVPGEKLLVQAKVKIDGIMQGENFFYKDQPLLHSQFYSFVTEKYSLIGELLRLDDTFLQGRLPVKRRIVVVGVFENLTENFADLIQPGDSAVLTNQGGHPSGETTLVIREVMQEKMPTDSESKDERRVQVVLECLCQFDDRGYSFSENYVRMGGAFNFVTELYTFTMKVQQIEVVGTQSGDFVSSPEP